MNNVLVTGMDLAEARRRQGVAAKDLAESMGVSRSYLSRLEHRYIVKPEAAERYRQALAGFPSLARGREAA